MANQDNLKKIAQEFVVIEEISKRMRRLQERQPLHETPHVQNSYPIWRGYNNYPAPKTIDSNQAAKKYGGVLVMEGRRKYRV
ncbi:hypothetical protein C2S53_012760 [Perilla frutescens var. hirtella]|uniref:Uncharacterized protein n=1 Tax=Perilla frutescens var. hirtella TaxID=608512 RepID=A0AAD4JEZ5_PERFH|nr:hypothetical protein C2S53_012760 [Perilla frutescens var. hirtella]